MSQKRQADPPEASEGGEKRKRKDDAIPKVIPWPWVELYDPKRERSYFFNSMTKQTTWRLPDEVTAAAESQAAPAVTPPTEPPKLPPAPSHAAIPGDSNEAISAAETSTPEELPPLGSVASHLAVFVRHDSKPSAKELGRPARKQQEAIVDPKKYAYEQGNEQYNIWYGKYLTDRFQSWDKRDDREPAYTRLNPYMDAGWTMADIDPETANPPFCIHFAKGACIRGSECKYFHRLPTQEDNDELDMMHDIFGRERFAQHRDDMEGVGSFNSDCRTLFIGDMKIDRMVPDYLNRTDTLIRKNFGIFGPVVQLRFIANKNIAFIRFSYRAAAEFAKVAMNGQKLEPSREGEILTVKWAHSDPNPRGQDEEEDKMREQARDAVARRMRQLGYTEDEITCLVMWGQEDASAVTSHYPDTDSRFSPAVLAASKAGEGARIPSDGQPHIGPLQHLPGPSEEEMEELERTRKAAVGVSRMQKVLNEIDSLDSSAFDVSV